MLPQFPLPSWLDGVGSALELMAFIGWTGSAVLLLVGAVHLVRELARRRRVALADAVGRPLVDAVRADAAVNGLRSVTSEDLTAAVDAAATERERRTSLVLDVDPRDSLAPPHRPGDR